MMRSCLMLAMITLLLAALCAGCKQNAAEPNGMPPPGGGAAMHWSLASEAFGEGELIPARYTCDGDNVSPALSWGEVPEGAKELALICDDPDAPRGTFTHWVIYGMPPESSSLPEAVPAMERPPAVGGAVQGKNGAGKIGYFGPCPPAGNPHHYHFRLYALGMATGLEPGASKDDLLKAIEGHILARAELVGLYERE